MSEELLDLITQVEIAFAAYLDAEEDRIIKERDFLIDIYASITEGATLELASTDSTNKFLLESLDFYFAEV